MDFHLANGDIQRISVFLTHLITLNKKTLFNLSLLFNCVTWASCC